MTAAEFKQRRIAAGLTQEALAARMCCIPRTIRNYENGKGGLPARVVKMFQLVLPLDLSNTGE